MCPISCERARIFATKSYLFLHLLWLALLFTRYVSALRLHRCTERWRIRQFISTSTVVLIGGGFVTAVVFKVIFRDRSLFLTELLLFLFQNSWWTGLTKQCCVHWKIINEIWTALWTTWRLLSKALLGLQWAEWRLADGCGESARGKVAVVDHDELWLMEAVTLWLRLVMRIFSVSYFLLLIMFAHSVLFIACCYYLLVQPDSSASALNYPMSFSPSSPAKDLMSFSPSCPAKDPSVSYRFVIQMHLALFDFLLSFFACLDWFLNVLHFSDNNTMVLYHYVSDQPAWMQCCQTD